MSTCLSLQSTSRTNYPRKRFLVLFWDYFSNSLEELTRLNMDASEASQTSPPPTPTGIVQPAAHSQAHASILYISLPIFSLLIVTCGHSFLKIDSIFCQLIHSMMPFSVSTGWFLFNLSFTAIDCSLYFLFELYLFCHHNSIQSLWAESVMWFSSPLNMSLSRRSIFKPHFHFQSIKLKDRSRNCTYRWHSIPT